MIEEEKAREIEEDERDAELEKNLIE